MGIKPDKIPYLRGSSGWLGAIEKKNIAQRGEKIESVRSNFQLFDYIPSHRGIRL
jgi:hypothetical protein